MDLNLQLILCKEKNVRHVERGYSINDKDKHSLKGSTIVEKGYVGSGEWEQTTTCQQGYGNANMQITGTQFTGGILSKAWGIEEKFY